MMGKRHWLSILCSIGVFITFWIRFHLSVAVVKMISESRETGNPESHISLEAVRLINSSFFWGYVVTQIPGGILAARFPANRVFGWSIAASALLSFFNPVAAKSGPVILALLRLLQGLAEGITFPALIGIWRHWAPPLERTKLLTICFAGSYVGAVVGFPLFGLLDHSLGWESCFYLSATVGLIWCGFWMRLSSEKPRSDPTIDRLELEMIEKSIGPVVQALVTIRTIPWKAIFLSKAVYAIAIANIAYSWTCHLLFDSQFKYFHQVFRFDVSPYGFLQVLPLLCMMIIVPATGQVADYLRKRKRLSTTQVRKVFTCGGSAAAAAFILVLAFTSNRGLAIAALVAALAACGLTISGFQVNHLDIAPRYASITMGISGCFAALTGILCPIVMEAMTKSGTLVEWRNLFILASVLNMCAAVVFAFCGSGEQEAWAEPAPPSASSGDDW